MTLLDPQGAIPGHRDINESGEVQVWKSGEGFNGYFVLSSDVVLASTNTDTGNTGDTTTLRGGNLIATETSLGTEYIYDADANDGTQSAWGILLKHQPMLESGSATNKVMVPIMSHGVYRTSEIVGLDAQAGAQLAQRGLFPDHALSGYAAFAHPMRVSQKTADYTVLAADNGTLFISTDAGDIEFTLPTIAVGLSFEFLQTIDDELLITSAEGDNIILKNDPLASGIKYTADGDQIGAYCRVLAVYHATTLKWVVSALSDAAITVVG